MSLPSPEENPQNLETEERDHPPIISEIGGLRRDRSELDDGVSAPFTGQVIIPGGIAGENTQETLAEKIERSAITTSSEPKIYQIDPDEIRELGSRLIEATDDQLDKLGYVGKQIRGGEISVDRAAELLLAERARERAVKVAQKSPPLASTLRAKPSESIEKPMTGLVTKREGEVTEADLKRIQDFIDRQKIEQDEFMGKLMRGEIPMDDNARSAGKARAQAILQHAMALDELRTSIAEGRGVVLTTKDGEEGVFEGFSVATIDETKPDADKVGFTYVGVDWAKTGQGLGGKLIDARNEGLVDAGITKIKTKVWADDTLGDARRGSLSIYQGKRSENVEEIRQLSGNQYEVVYNLKRQVEESIQSIPHPAEQFNALSEEEKVAVIKANLERNKALLSDVPEVRQAYIQQLRDEGWLEGEPDPDKAILLANGLLVPCLYKGNLHEATHIDILEKYYGTTDRVEAFKRYSELTKDGGIILVSNGPQASPMIMGNGEAIPEPEMLRQVVEYTAQGRNNSDPDAAIEIALDPASGELKRLLVSDLQSQGYDPGLLIPKEKVAEIVRDPELGRSFIPLHTPAEDVPDWLQEIADTVPKVVSRSQFFGASELSKIDQRRLHNAPENINETELNLLKEGYKEFLRIDKKSSLYVEASKDLVDYIDQSPVLAAVAEQLGRGIIGETPRLLERVLDTMTPQQMESFIRARAEIKATQFQQAEEAITKQKAAIIAQLPILIEQGIITISQAEAEKIINETPVVLHDILSGQMPAEFMGTYTVSEGHTSLNIGHSTIPAISETYLHELSHAFQVKEGHDSPVDPLLAEAGAILWTDMLLNGKSELSKEQALEILTTDGHVDYPQRREIITSLLERDIVTPQEVMQAAFSGDNTAIRSKVDNVLGAGAYDSIIEGMEFESIAGDDTAVAKLKVRLTDKNDSKADFGSPVVPSGSPYSGSGGGSEDPTPTESVEGASPSLADLEAQRDRNSLAYLRALSSGDERAMRRLSDEGQRLNEAIAAAREIAKPSLPPTVEPGVLSPAPAEAPLQATDLYRVALDQERRERAARGNASAPQDTTSSQRVAAKPTFQPVQPSQAEYRIPPQAVDAYAEGREVTDNRSELVKNLETKTGEIVTTSVGKGIRLHQTGDNRIGVLELDGSGSGETRVTVGSLQESRTLIVTKNNDGTVTYSVEPIELDKKTMSKIVLEYEEIFEENGQKYKRRREITGTLSLPAGTVITARRMYRNRVNEDFKPLNTAPLGSLLIGAGSVASDIELLNEYNGPLQMRVSKIAELTEGQRLAERLRRDEENERRRLAYISPRQRITETLGNLRNGGPAVIQNPEGPASIFDPTTDERNSLGRQALGGITSAAQAFGGGVSGFVNGVVQGSGGETDDGGAGAQRAKERRNAAIQAAIDNYEIAEAARAEAERRRIRNAAWQQIVDDAEAQRRQERLDEAARWLEETMRTQADRRGQRQVGQGDGSSQGQRTQPVQGTTSATQAEPGRDNSRPPSTSGRNRNWGTISGNDLPESQDTPQEPRRGPVTQSTGTPYTGDTKRVDETSKTSSTGESYVDEDGILTDSGESYTPDTPSLDDAPERSTVSEERYVDEYGSYSGSTARLPSDGPTTRLEDQTPAGRTIQLPEGSGSSGQRTIQLPGSSTGETTRLEKNPFEGMEGMSPYRDADGSTVWVPEELVNSDGTFNKDQFKNLSDQERERLYALLIKQFDINSGGRISK